MLSAKEVYAAARQGGFSPVEAVIMTAIAGFRGSVNPGESHGNPKAHNYNPATGDDSWGLWQINMLGSMGPQRRALFGITSNEQLLDPITNAKAAHSVFKSQGYNAWSAFKNRNHTANLAKATAAGQATESPATWKRIAAGLANPTGLAKNILGGVTNPVENAISEATNELKRAAFTGLFGLGGIALIVLGIQQSIAPTIRRAVRNTVGI